jgi:hypothetical protein
MLRPAAPDLVIHDTRPSDRAGQIGQGLEVVVRRARTAVEDHQRRGSIPTEIAINAGTTSSPHPIPSGLRSHQEPTFKRHPPTTLTLRLEGQLGHGPRLRRSSRSASRNRRGGTGDYKRPGVREIIYTAVGGASPAAIILMHGGGRSEFVAALPRIIRRLRLGLAQESLTFLTASGTPSHSSNSATNSCASP